MPLMILYCNPQHHPIKENDSNSLNVFMADDANGFFHQIAWSQNFSIVAVDKTAAPHLYPGVPCNYFSMENLISVENLKDKQQVRANLTGGEYVISSHTLETYEQWVHAGTFMRVNKDHLVNLDRVVSFKKCENTLVLPDNREIPCDREFIPQILWYISHHQDHMHTNDIEQFINPNLKNA